MLFVHLLLGLVLGAVFGNTIPFVLGSLFPDIDHFYVLIKNRFFDLKKIRASIKPEKRLQVKYKTPLLHSLLGVVIFSLIVFLIKPEYAPYFAIAYLLHLIIDWPDIDVKYYLYPLKIKFQGPLDLFSRLEIAFTFILIAELAILYFVL